MIRQRVSGLATKIMRNLKLERDRTQNRWRLLLTALRQTGFHFPGSAMRLIVIAVGRLKQGPERELAERYRKRLDDIGRKLGFRGIEIHEIAESRARAAAARIAEEAATIASSIPENSVLVTLDERGENIDSVGLARHIGRIRDEAVAAMVFVIGGADGLSPELGRKERLRLAFGTATWPHQMVRVMLLEQLYRAATILSGHPYHRDRKSVV